MDQINEIQDVADEPEDFDIEIFTSVQFESRKISEKCVQVLKDARDMLTKNNLQVLEVERDDRTGLPSMRPRGNSNSTEASVSTSAPSLRIVTPSVEADSGPPPKPHGSWNIESPQPPDDHDVVEASSSRLDRLPVIERKPVSTDPIPSPRSRPVMEEKPVSTDPADFITEDVVDGRVKANDDFLERRKYSRIAFHNEFRKSISSVDENRESVYSDIVSPISPTVISPIEGRPSDTRRSSSNDYPSFINGQRGFFLPSDRKRTSTTSSQYTASTTPGDRQSTSSHSNHTAEEEIVFRHNSNAGSTRSSTALAATLKIPGFGQGVEDGLIVVEDPAAIVDYDNEKEIVPNDHPQYHSTTPTASMKSIDSPMRHDSSFYKFGGFCEGALIASRGELSHKIVKRPTVSYDLLCSYVTANEVIRELMVRSILLNV